MITPTIFAKPMNHDSTALFSLFHHQVLNVPESNNHYLPVIQESKRNHEVNFEDIARALVESVTENIRQNIPDNKVSLTLTGGMDSRLILACFLKRGIKPNCFTYGDPGSKDVVFAEMIAKRFGLSYHNAISEPPSKDWYYKWVVETIKTDNGKSHLHRAHRTAAIAEHSEIYNPKVLFTGHMGGEGIRGLTYNNYFASPFFEWVNEGKKEPLDAAKIVLRDYFLKTEDVGFETVLRQVSNLPWMQQNKELNKFFFLFGLVANIHHAQDLRIFNSYVENVVPVFLQKNYLETLFSSNYHFLAKYKGIAGRLKNPWLYCKLIEQIYPPLLDLPLANGFSPHEYLKGLWYYIPAKLYRDYSSKDKYPPSFSYGKWYQEFVREHALNIAPDIWEVYDKKCYFEEIEKPDHKTDEGYWHKFSNPIYFDLVEKYKKGQLK